MADRTSCDIFGDIFELLAEKPDKYRDLAHKIYKLSTGYDFCSEQMCVDDELLRLGVARVGIDPLYPDDGKVVLYLGGRGYENAKDMSSE